MPEMKTDEAHRPPAGDTLLGRLAEQDAQIRRLRRQSMLMVVALAVLVGLAVALTYVAARHGLPGTTAEVVAAEQFMIRDGGGRIRGAWGVAGDGSVRFVLNDETGKSRVRLSLLPDGSSGLSFPDSTEQGRVVLGVLPDETTTLVLADRRGQPRAVLGVTPDGASTLVFADRGGVTKAGLGVDARGLGTFSVVERPGGRIGEQVEDVGDSVAAEPVDQQPASRR